MPTKKTGKKIKNVLIISASFRPNANSHALCQEVARGVKAAGNKAEVIRLKDKRIGFCTGCYACQKLGKCVIKDDANAIVEKICRADAVVFGTPVYYFSIAGQLKALFDRCVAKWPEPNGKPYYLVATMAENMDWDLVKAPLQGFVDCFEGTISTSSFSGRPSVSAIFSGSRKLTQQLSTPWSAAARIRCVATMVASSTPESRFPPG